MTDCFESLRTRDSVLLDVLDNNISFYLDKIIGHT